MHVTGGCDLRHMGAHSDSLHASFPVKNMTAHRLPSNHGSFGSMLARIAGLSTGSGKEKYLRAGVPKRVYSVGLLGATTEFR